MWRGQTMVRAESEPFWQLRRRQQELGVRLMRRQGILIGLLIAATSIGSIDVVLRSSFVTGTQPQKEKPAFAKIQDRLNAAEPAAASEPATARSVSLQTSEQSDSKPRVSVAEVDAFSVNNIRPTVGFVTHPASSTQQAPAASTTLVSSQSRIVAEPHAVPVPRRKPSSAPALREKRPITKEAQTTTVKQQPMEQEQGTQPKPMAFGSIGYNYDPQR
jgi:hypothetical protein